MAGGQYRDRGIARVAGHSPAERSQCSRNCGISAEQGCDVMRILQGKAAEAYVCELERRGSRLDEVEPAVRRIIENVRRKGDRALRNYAYEFDGLSPDQSLRVSEAELDQAWKKASGELKTALRTAAKNISQ